ncbi:11409_t:CDS:2, partial [Gigaspora rosea]
KINAFHKKLHLGISTKGTNSELIAKAFRVKRDTSTLLALNSNQVKLKAWPNEWKPYIKVWGRVKERILARSNWPWEESEDCKYKNGHHVEIASWGSSAGI